METVIAIGVIAVLITGFIAVFAPAVDGIRRSISSEEASRLTSTLEREIATLREGQEPDVSTGFAKAFEWIQDSDQAPNALFIYQYRGDINTKRNDDGTPVPYTESGGIAGRDFITVPMLRRRSDAKLLDDFAALEGRAFVVRCTQLVYNADGALIRGLPGVIIDPKGGGAPAGDAASYPEAVLTFAADFYSLPGRSPQYIQGDGFTNYFNDRMSRPMFTRNIAVRR
jgi:hypothetical protein